MKRRIRLSDWNYYFHDSAVAKMISGDSYQQGYSVGFSSGYQQGIKEALSKYSKWLEENPDCDKAENCERMCYDCFIREMEQKK